MILQKVLAYNDYVTPIAYMRRITINCNELLIKCKWDNKETDCMDLFSTSYSTDGICCIFNANLGLVLFKKEKKTSKNLCDYKMIIKTQIKDNWALDTDNEKIMVKFPFVIIKQSLTSTAGHKHKY